MDSFGVPNFNSDQKTNAGECRRLVNYRSFQRLNATFRVMEVCVFLIIVSRFTTHLLDAIKLSGDYIWGLLSGTSVKPLFVFLTVNTIVIVLFLKSRQPKKGIHEEFNPITDLDNDYAMNCDKIVKTEEKQRACIAGGRRRHLSPTLIRDVGDDVACDIKEKKKISRSRSVIFKEVNHLHHHQKESCRELRRSLTERRRKQGSEEKWVAENEMSNEEFKRKIEAFIARQQRVLREEEEEE